MATIAFHNVFHDRDSAETQAEGIVYPVVALSGLRKVRTIRWSVVPVALIPKRLAMLHIMQLQSHCPLGRDQYHAEDLILVYHRVSLASGIAVFL